MKKNFHYGPWLIEFTPEDGARLDRMVYENYDLITTEPKSFRKPSANYGEYENRPVYGYDDCFPSVVECPYPGMKWNVPDHGEVCWLSWNYHIENNILSFNTESKVLPIKFKREMIFTDTNIVWNFEVINKSDYRLPFQHVIHPLMKLSEISSIHFPEFQSIYNRTLNKDLELNNSNEVLEYLQSQPTDTANMLFMKEINAGKITWTYKNGLLIKMIFPKKYFPTIGIWWNNSGYPNELGIKRNECAFEPIPGFSAQLSEAYNNGNSLAVLPNDRFKWQIIWELYN